MKKIIHILSGFFIHRRKDLMKHFANIEAIKNATVEELKNLPSMNEKSNELVLDCKAACEM